MKIVKKTDELEFEAYLILPSFKINKKVRSLEGEQKTTFFHIPFIFNLTTQESLFILEIGLVIGLEIKLRVMEKTNEQKTKTD